MTKPSPAPGGRPLERLRAAVEPWLTADGRPRTRVLLVIILVVAFAAIAFLADVAEDVLEAVADHDGIALWDRPVLDWMIAQRTPALDGAIAWFSNTGGPLWQPIVTAVVVGLLCWRWRDWTPLVLTVVAVGGSLVLTVLGKDAIGRLRPPEQYAIPPYETSFSWPSGHSLNALVISGILAYLVIRHIWDRPAWLWMLVGALFAVYAASMGLSRVYLGHHWLTDVIGAWALGLAWLTVVIAAHRVWRTLRKRSEPGPIEEERARGSSA